MSRTRKQNPIAQTKMIDGMSNPFERDIVDGTTIGTLTKREKQIKNREER
jgi:hypothetical protein